MRASRRGHAINGFTLIELLLVIGIIAILAAVVIVAINPSKQVTSARNRQRQSEQNAIQKAFFQYQIDTGKLPDEANLPTDKENAKPICRDHLQAADTTCINSDVLVPTYLASMPVDASETNQNYTGYRAARVSGQPVVLSSYYNRDPALFDGLVAYVRFDTPGKFYDTSTTHATVASTTLSSLNFRTDFPAAVQDNAGSYQFADYDYVAFNPTASQSTSTALTLAGWVKLTGYTTTYAYHPLAKWTSTANANFAWYIFGNYPGNMAGGLTGLYANAGGSWVSLSIGAQLPLNRWTHVAFTYHKTNGGRTFINGTQVGSTTTPHGDGVLATNSAPLQIEGGNTVLFDDFRVYNRELSASEVAELAQGM